MFILLNLLYSHLYYSSCYLTSHLGYDKESSYLHTTSSTIPLTEYTIRLRKLADQGNVGDCLWQTRAQDLSQEVGLIMLTYQ